MKKVSKIRAPVHLKGYPTRGAGAFHPVALVQLLYCTQKKKGSSNEKKQ
ncbi:hypothetical protein LKF67_2532 [Lactococcus lactis subsp. lactis]|nr:hypothetical protein [Lactococcus lactis]KST88018.1 hypothetical protein LKF67_2532 [Lactococcus lactis subsp. lactis]